MEKQDNKTDSKDYNKVVSVSIEKEMQQSYLDYAMSVIVSRALPDCRDGLKPVHRRILYAMHDTGNHNDKAYRKSARVVGEVMGKYHPHGDSPIYGAMVRMAQDFSLMAPLIDGQGNFGSVDGDEAAHMRYTEARLAKIADFAMLPDLEYETVAFQDNYDSSEREPRVLPVQFPNLLVNGANGIAVGMATNIPTHNLNEVINACCAYIDNQAITIEEMLEYIPAPDFPTGGEIVGTEKLRVAMTHGRGSIHVRGKASVDEDGQRVIITEIPYQVNKSELVKAIEGLAVNKIVEGITEVRDESNKLGMRIVVEYKRDANGHVLLNQIYKHTQLATTFGVNILALKDGKPIVMNVRDIIEYFVAFREEVVTRRVAFLLNKARNRAHILIGLLIAIANIDEVISTIKTSSDAQEAKERLLQKPWRVSGILQLIVNINDKKNKIVDENIYLTEQQVQAILDMKLQRLTGLENDKITHEVTQLSEEINGYLSILGSKEKLLEVIKSELLAIQAKFGVPRKTQIAESSYDIDDEDLIQREEMVVTITKTGYIKRTHLSHYREQKRGGRGKIGISVHEDDVVTDMIVANTHDNLLFFSDMGQVYRMKIYKLPLGNPQSKGRALVNLLSLKPEEKISSILALKDGLDKEQSHYIIFSTANGMIRRNSLEDFYNIPSNGKIAIRLDEGDKLVGVALATEDDHIMLATKKGKAIRFPISVLRVFKSRKSDGVQGIKLENKEDSVIVLLILSGIKIGIEKREAYLKIPLEDRLIITKALKDGTPDIAEKVAQKVLTLFNQDVLSVPTIITLAGFEQFILTITNNGFAKQTSAYEYRVTARGGQGVQNIKLSTKGNVVAVFPTQEDDSIIIVTDAGILIRTSIKDIRITGRNTIGVRAINLQKDDVVSSVSKIVEEKDEKE